MPFPFPLPFLHASWLRRITSDVLGMLLKDRAFKGPGPAAVPFLEFLGGMARWRKTLVDELQVASVA